MNTRPEFKLEVHGCLLTSVTTWHEGNKSGGLPIATTNIDGEPSAEDFDNADELARRWNAHEELVAALLEALGHSDMREMCGKELLPWADKARAVLAKLENP